MIIYYNNYNLKIYYKPKWQLMGYLTFTAERAKYYFKVSERKKNTT